MKYTVYNDGKLVALTVTDLKKSTFRFFVKRDDGFKQVKIKSILNNGVVVCTEEFGKVEAGLRLPYTEVWVETDAGVENLNVVAA